MPKWLECLLTHALHAQAILFFPESADLLYMQYLGMCCFFFLIYVGVRINLRASRLIPRPTKHPANSVSM